MNKEFVAYEQALELKQLGFDEPCIACYTENAIRKGDELQYFVQPTECNDDFVFVSAPLYQQAFRWFREKYGLDNATMKDKFVIEIDEDLPKWHYGFNTYEEAELACLIKLIQIAKEVSK
jgi:hypothetical protein